MPFVQIIEFKTSKYDEVEKLTDEFLASTEGKRTTSRGMMCSDRDRSGTYFEIIVFPSYEAAMKNNDLPETKAFAEKMMALCDGEPIFRNLDVLREEEG